MSLPRLFESLPAEPAPADVERILQKVSFPYVDGSSVTFAFVGEAEQVAVRHWIYGLPSSLPLKRVEGTDLWVLQADFPAGSRIEYKFGVTRDGHEEWIFDPLNEQVANDPFGGNSVTHGGDYERPDWTFRDPSVRQGRIERFALRSEALGGERQVGVYLPAGYRPYRRHRLLVVHDGEDYLRYSQLDNALDNLIARREVSPLVVALTNPVDRLREYAHDERHARHIVEELVPVLEQRYSLIPEGSGRSLMGASFGGVASLSTAWLYPGAFDSLLLQSGSFAFTDIGGHSRSPVFDPVVAFMNAFRKAPGRPVNRAFVSCGMFESLIYENRSLVPFLQKHGIETTYEEAYDGHNWENWRDRLRKGLSRLFPGPLWESYL